MSVLNVVLMCVAVVCVCSAAPDSCSWTRFRLGRLNDQSILLLSDMGAHFPAQCLREKVARMFPEGVYVDAQHEDVSLVSLRALSHVARIFNNNLTSVTWNREKLGLFKNIISRQVDKLEACVGDVVTTSGDGGGVNTTDVSVSLKAYFDQLESLLKEKEHSACAWETVRSEVRYHVVQLKRFLESTGEQ